MKWKRNDNEREGNSNAGGPFGAEMLETARQLAI